MHVSQHPASNTGRFQEPHINSSHAETVIPWELQNVQEKSVSTAMYCMELGPKCWRRRQFEKYLLLEREVSLPSMLAGQMRQVTHIDGNNCCHLWKIMKA